MIQVLQDLPPNVLGLQAKGKVSRQDYEGTVIPQIEQKQREFDKLRMLYVMAEDFQGYTPGAVWEDATLAFKHPASWEKIAIVTDEDSIRRAIALFSWMVPGEVRVFTANQSDEARDWAAH